MIPLASKGLGGSQVMLRALELILSNVMLTGDPDGAVYMSNQ